MSTYDLFYNPQKILPHLHLVTILVLFIKIDESESFYSDSISRTVLLYPVPVVPGRAVIVEDVGLVVVEVVGGVEVVGAGVGAGVGGRGAEGAGPHEGLLAVGPEDDGHYCQDPGRR